MQKASTHHIQLKQNQNKQIAKKADPSKTRTRKELTKKRKHHNTQRGAGRSSRYKGKYIKTQAIGKKPESA